MNIAEVKTISDIAVILQAEQERNEQFRSSVIELLTQLVKPAVEPVPTVDPYKLWADDIGNIIKLIIENTSYSNNKAVLSEAYRRMNRKYGVVFEQEKHEYYEQNGTMPENNMVLTYYIEEKNPANKGLLKSILVNIAHEEEKSVDNKLKNFPAKSIEDLDDVVIQLGGEEHAPNFVSEYRSYVAYLKRNSDINWDKYVMKYCVDEQTCLNPKNVRKMRIIRKYPELQKIAVKVFNEWVKEKFADRI